MSRAMYVDFSWSASCYHVRSSANAVCCRFWMAIDNIYHPIAKLNASYVRYQGKYLKSKTTSLAVDFWIMVLPCFVSGKA